MDAPTAERLSYVEGLRLQSAPQLGDPDFVDHRNPVRGGIPAHSAASTAAQRGFNRFARRYPHLAEQVRRNPGRSSRNSYARETGGRRVAHGLLGEGLESVDENATQTASEEVLERIRQDLRSETDEDETVFVDGVLEEDGSSSSSAPTQVTRTVGGRAVTRLPEDRDTVIPEDNQTEFSEATLTHAPTSVWYSVDEEETEEAAEQATEENEQQEAAEGDSGEVGQEQYEDNYSSSSYSTGSYSTSRASSSNWSHGRDHWERYEPYHANYRFQHNEWRNWADWGAYDTVITEAGKQAGNTVLYIAECR